MDCDWPVLNRYVSRGVRQTIIRYFRALLYLFNVHTLLLAGAGCLAVYACDRWQLQFNMDFSLVATGTTFPLVFTIQQAFTRREKALSLVANLKASAVGLYYMHRDWCQDESFPASMGNDHNTAALQCKLLLIELLRDVRRYLVAESHYESYAEQRLAARRHECANLLLADISLSGASQLSFAVALEKAEKTDPAATALRRCYRAFSRLSVLNERLGLRAGYTKGGEGGMSRTNQYLRYIISNVEELRFLKEYRTPIMMRAAHGVLLHLFAVILAPYFVHFCDSWTALGYTRSSCPAGYTASIVYCLITMLLFNTQQDLENPFDMNGMDDVFFEMDREMDDAWQPMGSMAVTPSGYASPRHFGATGVDTCCPTSPNPRNHPDLSWPQPAPWAQQKMAAAAAAGATSISRRGSTLGTVTEEDFMIGVEPAAEAPQPEPQAPIPTGAADKTPSMGMSSAESSPFSAAAAAGVKGSSEQRSSGSPSLLGPHAQVREVRAGLQQPSSQPPLASPRSSGAGAGAAAPSTVRAPAACLGGLRQRSPFERLEKVPVSPAGHLQEQHRPQQHARSSDGSIKLGVELIGHATLARRYSSGDGPHDQQVVAARSRSSSLDSSFELGGDSSTQLIRDGACRSDEHAD